MPLVLRRPAAVGFVLTLIACSDAASPNPDHLADVHLIALETFDGSGQAVHPDAALTPLSWGASETELFVTPYPYGDAAKENPSLYARRSLLDWPVPPGVMNPIARPDAGYLSDPDQVFNPETNELWLYYRRVTTQNEIFLVRGGAPTVWSLPTLVVTGANHTVVSPTVVRRGRGDWLMWSVNSGASGCSSSSTTVELRPVGANCVRMARRCGVDSLQGRVLDALQRQDPRLMHYFGSSFRQECGRRPLGGRARPRAGARRDTGVRGYRLSCVTDL